MGSYSRNPRLGGEYYAQQFLVPYSSLEQAAPAPFLGQSFPNPIDVGQLWVDPNTCLTWVYDPQRNQWVWVDQPPDAECLRRKTAIQPPPPTLPPATRASAGPSWFDQELITGVKNWWLLGWGAGVFLLVLAARKKKVEA